MLPKSDASNAPLEATPTPLAKGRVSCAPKGLSKSAVAPQVAPHVARARMRRARETQCARSVPVARVSRPKELVAARRALRASTPFLLATGGRPVAPAATLDIFPPQAHRRVPLAVQDSSIPLLELALALPARRDTMPPARRLSAPLVLQATTNPTL